MIESSNYGAMSFRKQELDQCISNPHPNTECLDGLVKKLFQRYQLRTPTTAANWTRHRWSVAELITYPFPPAMA